MAKDPLVDAARILAKGMAGHRIGTVGENGTEIKPEKLSVRIVKEQFLIDYPRAVRIVKQLEKEGFQVEYNHPKEWRRIPPVVKRILKSKKFLNGLKVALLIPLPLVISVLLIRKIIIGGVGKDTAVRLAIISVALIITAVIARKLHKKRCKKCGKWNALKRIKTEESSREPVMVRKTLREWHRSSTGEKIEVTKEAIVPGERVSYIHTMKCKFCGDVSYECKIYEV